jgi:serine/threonine protein kinase
MSLITNRRCTKIESFTRTHELLHACTSFPDLNLIDILGEGTFGIVYLGEAKYNGKKIYLAVKIIKMKLTEADFDDLNYEITFSYTMGIHGLGPKIYDAFYFVEKNGNYKQVIIMDYFKYDGTNALSIATKEQATDIIIKMIELIKEMIFVNRMYCVDIKPGNFVINEKLNDVKLIDFGNDWCFPQELMTRTENELFNILIFQLYYLILKRPCSLNHNEITSIFSDYISENLQTLINNYFYDELILLRHYFPGKIVALDLARDMYKTKRSPPSRNRVPN